MSRKAATVLRVARSTTRLLWRSAPRLTLFVLLSQVAAAAGAAAALLLVRALIATLVGDTGGSGGPLPLLLGLGALLGSSSVLLAVQRHLMTLLGEHVAMYAMERVLDVACRVELAAFDSPEFHGRLRRVQDAGHRPIEFTEALLSATSSLLTGVAVLGTLWVIDPLLVVCVLLSTVPLLLAGAAASRGMFTLSVDLVRNDLRRTYVRSLMTGRESAKEVRVFGLASALSARHRTLFAERLVALRAVLRRITWLSLLGGVGTALGVALGGGLLVRSVAAGELTVASAATAVAALMQVVPLLVGASQSVAQVYENSLFVDDYERFCADEARLPVAAEGRPAPASLDRVTVEHVTFTYPGAAVPALRDVSLSVRRGEVVALVGPNGSGKTTLAKLLCGLYRPDLGAIRWDGTDLAELDPDGYRARLTVMFQDFIRYQFTAAENIALSTQRSVAEAARRAGVHDFVARLPAGYETVLSRELSDGVDLSGGQWQRIALARAFHRDAPLVVLDEPTAALDAEAEHDLFTRLRDLYTDRAVVLVSHRFSTVREADRIYVVEGGTVTESGEHRDLMALDRTYARMFRLQAAGYAPPLRPAGTPVASGRG
ncbi:ABC transporter ATP-binding protein [Cryptosporangium minutisporangium]|uniref:ABC transporter ATP-binding protein n=1 Tax=Cryptosporangium minutisporangium TaxID=113569 RepID=A0ABP6SZD7_9ACTN